MTRFPRNSDLGGRSGALDFVYLSRMARPLRIEFPGALYHVTARGNARQDIYLVEQDRRDFLRMLGEEVDRNKWACHGYCLMTNHYHGILQTPEPNLGRACTA